MSEVFNSATRCLLMILDGFGINPESKSNAIQAASTKCLDKLFSDYPFTTLIPGGQRVGLPKGVFGNSEVGHMNIGAGRPVRQDLVRINEAIQNQTFKNLFQLKELIKTARNNSGRVHLVTLLSDGGVHSHIDHLKEVIKCLNDEDKKIEIFVHAFMDGRDTSRDSGIKYLQELLDFKINYSFTLASVQGRSIGMDRDRRWEKIKLCMDTFCAKGKILDIDPISYLKEEYAQGRYDEFIYPILFKREYAIFEKDCLFTLNFRPDRMIQLALAFNWSQFKEFERDFIPPYYLCMTPYVQDEVELPILFDKEPVPGGLTEYLSALGKKQLKIAETEKYAHVTYFFNGGRKEPFPGEEQILIPSPKEVKTYDEKPEMSAYEVADKLREKLDDESISFYCVNFANSDMVGHTGNFEAAVKAIEALDQCVEKIAKKCLQDGIALIITADHGNSDIMKYPDGSPHTSHSDANVPFCLVHSKFKNKKFKLNKNNFALKDIAPTILSVLGIKPPDNFEGVSIF
ncbi:MAG: 2,3-bisphosphoglycerate-independent phosphoglycerate mutase [Halobacteriovoraceae bacterium]|nr:2,3-bisphosphoglycerate-independent phosphoglycerate mutase [Halobacteriovoraceae bacterium]